ncbi:Major facilitator superfamily domain-containing protein 10 [Toxocara canis]|uniref:Major facilitator superfamily domain-containing protein 10 n=1 Tax=Toxocara canis TaxID=6265 RepID=A0A0B2VWA6_TOXCA|nr:Major facilitator superfamily domain-containing protein 10 [Toxocara canis]
MFILISALILDLLAFTCILPLFPSIIDFYAKQQHRDFLYDAFDTVTTTFQSAIGAPHLKRFNSVFFGGFLGSLFSALQFLSSPVLGALSDIYGRKPILLISLCGSLLSYLLWSQASTFSVFVLSRITGGLSKASVSISTAIISDLYPEQRVGKGMALLGIAFSIGFIVGPLFGAYFSHSARALLDEDLFYTTPANFALLLTFVEITVILLLMSETLESSKRKATVDDVRRKCALYVKPNALFSFSAVSDTVGKKEIQMMRAYGRAYFAYLFLYSGLEFTLAFFTHMRFQYDSMQQGRMYVFTGVLMMLLQGGFVRRIPAEKQHSIVLFAIALIVPSFITIAFAQTQAVFYAGLALYAVASAIVVPCLTSCISRLASAHSKGATIGVFRCLGALARALGPLFASTARALLDEDLFYTTPANFALLLTFVEITVILLLMSETLESSKRKATVDDVRRKCALYVKPNALFSFSAVSDTVGKKEIQMMRAYGRAYFAYLFLYSGLEFTLAFFTHMRFQYDSMQQGRMYVFTGVLMMLLQGGFVRRIPAEKQHSIVLFAIALIVPSFITIAFAQTQAVFYAGLALYAVASAIVVPCLTSCISRLASAHSKGATIGVFRCLGALARALGPLFASTVFWLIGPTICYVAGGIALIIPFLMLRSLPNAKATVKTD